LVDSRLQPISNDRTTITNAGTWRLANQLVVATRIAKSFGVPGSMPIWQGVQFSIFDPPIQITVPAEPGEYVLAWTVDAPRMQQKQGF
jgi:hypothetical protein